MSHQNVSSKCLIKCLIEMSHQMSHQNVLSKCVIKMSHNTVSSNKKKIKKYGFVLIKAGFVQSMSGFVLNMTDLA